MPLLDFFKKKQEEIEKKEKKAEKKKKIEKEKISSPDIKEPKKFKETSESHRVLKEPHISEKATDLGKENQYVFKIYPEANKSEIKKAVESFYKVDVLAVNIVKIPRKKRRFKKFLGFKKGYKKAIVKIKEGQKIEIL